MDISSLPSSFAGKSGSEEIFRPLEQPPAAQQMKVEEVFQDFVAGTFYKQMLKALRKTQSEPAYFFGGQAERMFQGQLDQEVASNLSKTSGKQFSQDLFKVFLQSQNISVAK